MPCRTLYAGCVLINMHIKQEFLFEEKRTCPAVSKRLGKSTDTWYLTKETKEDNYTYSLIILNNSTEQGKKILLIGLNPRGERPISEEAMEYEEAKKISPDMKHRKECKNAIEPTRRQVLTDILSKFPDIKFSELITVDIFSSRTKDSANLYKKIKNSRKPEEIIGSEIVIPCRFKSQKAYVQKVLESEVDKRLESEGKFTTIANLQKDWPSYNVQSKQNELSSPSENAIRLAFLHKKRDIISVDKDLADKETEILKKGLQTELVANNTVTPDELKKMIKEHEKLKDKKEKLI